MNSKAVAESERDLLDLESNVKIKRKLFGSDDSEDGGKTPKSLLPTADKKEEVLFRKKLDAR